MTALLARICTMRLQNSRLGASDGASTLVPRRKRVRRARERIGARVHAEVLATGPANAVGNHR